MERNYKYCYSTYYCDRVLIIKRELRKHYNSHNLLSKYILKILTFITYEKISPIQIKK